MNKITSVYVKLPPENLAGETGSSVAPINTLEFTIDDILNHYEIHSLLIFLDLNSPQNGELPYRNALTIRTFFISEWENTVFTYKKLIRGTSLGWHYKDAKVRHSRHTRCGEFILLEGDVQLCFELVDYEPSDDGADAEDKEQGVLLDPATGDVFGVVFAFRVLKATPTERKVLLGVTYLNLFIGEIKRLMEDHHVESDKVVLPPVLPLEYNTDEDDSVFTGGSCVFVRRNICIMRKPVKSTSPIGEIRIKKFETMAITDDFQSTENMFEIHETLIFMRLTEPQSGQIPFHEFGSLAISSEDVFDQIKQYGPIKYFRSRTYKDDYAYIEVELLSKGQCNDIVHYNGHNQYCFRLVDPNGIFNDHRDHFAEGVLLHPHSYRLYGIVTNYMVTKIGLLKHRTIAVYFWATLFGATLTVDIEMLGRETHLKTDTITELVEMKWWWSSSYLCIG